MILTAQDWYKNQSQVFSLSSKIPLKVSYLPIKTKTIILSIIIYNYSLLLDEKFVLFCDINFWPTEPKISQKEPLALI